jgi:hypothetical protein
MLDGKWSAAVIREVESTGDVVSLTTQFVPVGPTGTSAVFGRMSGRIAPVGVSVGAGNSGGFVLTMAFGGLSGFSDEPV